MKEHEEIENERARDLAISVSLGMRMPVRSLRKAFSTDASKGGQKTKSKSGHEYWKEKRRGKKG